MVNIYTFQKNTAANISVCKGFDPSKSGAAYWNTLKETGDLIENVIFLKI